MESLSGAAEQAADDSELEGRSGKGYNISLILKDDDQVCFFHWSSWGISGMEVHLDDRDRVKFSTALFCPPQAHFDFQWIVPDCGVEMLKRTPAFRAVMPSWVVRLRRMCSVAVEGADHDPYSAECCLCGEIGSGTAVIAKQCSVCLLFWHRSCASMVSEGLGAVASRQGVPFNLTPLLRSKACACCLSRFG